MKTDTIKSRYKYIGTTAEIITMTFFSFITANSTFATVQSSLNVALMGALPPIYACSVLAGSLIAYFTAKDFLNSAVMICAMLLVAGVRIFINRYISNIHNCLITTMCMLGGGIVIFTATEQGIDAIGIHICVSILTGIVQYFLNQLFYEDEYGFHINTDSVVSISVAYTLLIATMSSISVWYINVGVVLATVGVLCGAKIYGTGGGGVCGILSTCGMLLYSSQLGFSVILYAIGGLVCGMVKEHNRVIYSIFFVCVNVIGLLIIGSMELFTLMIAGLLIGTTIYMLIPNVYLTAETDKQILPCTAPDTSFIGTIEARLKYSAQTIKDVRENSSEIAKAIEKKSKPLDTTSELYKTVCYKCKNYSYCWEKNTLKSKSKFEQLKSLHVVNLSSLPKEFDWCFKRLELVEAFNRLMDRNSLLNLNSKKSKESRDVLYYQLQLVEDVIGSVMNDMLVRYQPKPKIVEEVSAMLRSRRIPYVQVSAYINDNARLTIEMFFNQELSNLEEWEDYLSEVANRDMEYLNTVCIQEVYRATFCEVKEYSMEVYTIQKTSNGYSVCGDTADDYIDCNYHQYAIISDGMGRGSSASLNSQLAVKLFKKLTVAGIGVSTAVDTINSLMLTKSAEEGFATLDVLQLDVYSGTADIYKAGATATIVKSKDSIKLIEGISYPLGIMDSVTLYNHKLNLNIGDIIVMISDGVGESLYQYIKMVLNTSNCGEVDILAKTICDATCKNSTNNNDDVTVTVIKII